MSCWDLVTSGLTFITLPASMGNGRLRTRLPLIAVESAIHGQERRTSFPRVMRKLRLQQQRKCLSEVSLSYFEMLTFGFLLAVIVTGVAISSGSLFCLVYPKNAMMH